MLSGVSPAGGMLWSAEDAPGLILWSVSDAGVIRWSPEDPSGVILWLSGVILWLLESPKLWDPEESPKLWDPLGPLLLGGRLWLHLAAPCAVAASVFT